MPERLLVAGVCQRGMRDLHFIHISDSHIGPDQSYTLHGINTFRTTQKIVTRIRQILDAGVPVDFVVHTGDVTADGDDILSSDSSTCLAAQLFSDLPIPLYTINGNHDDLARLARAFAHPALEAFIPGARSLAGMYRVGEDLLVFLDARPDLLSAAGVPVADPGGYIPTEQLLALEVELAAGGEGRVSVFLHYPPVQLDSPWLDRSMLVTNNRELHNLLVRYSPRVAGVFFGHVHQSLQITTDNILYSAVGSLSCQFSGWPADERVSIGSEPVGHFQYVALCGRSTLIKQHVVVID